MNIPTEHDWAHHPDDLDAAWAKRNFLGKSREEAVALFVENSLLYQEDILFMPLPCFTFYVHAYMDYLMSDQSKEDADGASCFFGIVEGRKKDILACPSVLRERIRMLLLHIGDRQRWYDADMNIDGDFKQKAKACLRMIEE